MRGALLCLAAEMRASDQRGSIVTLICDHGERYTDTYYDDAWIQEQGLELAPYAETLEHCMATGEWREPDPMLLRRPWSER
jgi:cysteine synthase A